MLEMKNETQEKLSNVLKGPLDYLCFAINYVYECLIYRNILMGFMKDYFHLERRGDL